MEAQVPAVVAPLNAEREEYWRHVDDSVNAVSFGFVATAILISMFLLMAIFEKFLRSRSQQHPSPSRTSLDLEQQRVYGAKFDYPSPKMTIYARGVSVLMPGEEVPTFIAHPAPAPCPPEGILRPFHQHSPSSSSGIQNQHQT
ncbi:hypothetical protein UlMin_014374 [Ulmus minor]